MSIIACPYEVQERAAIYEHDAKMTPEDANKRAMLEYGAVMKTVKHPHIDLSIIFDEKAHTYTDSKGLSYVSSTTLVKRAFPVFDSRRIAEKISTRDERNVDEVLAEWEIKRDLACAIGTRTHQNAEATIRGEQRPNSPRNEREIALFKLAKDTALKIKARYCSKIEAEKIIFSPFYRIAGTIDLLAWSGNDYVILDWKTNEEIKRENQHQSGVVFGLEHVQDCDIMRYAMQLSTYEIILRREGYIPDGAKVKRFLVHLTGDAPVYIETPCMRNEVNAILLEQVCIARLCEGLI